MSIAAQLGIPAEPRRRRRGRRPPLEQLAASRSERDADQAAAAQAQAAADQAELEARRAPAAAEAARGSSPGAEAARVEAAREAQARQAAEAEAAAAAAAVQRRAPPPPPRPPGSYQEYAMGKLGGDGSQFTCLENLWGKESGWNPNAQNPTSTAYGIPQFLNSTWAGTGIAKTSDGYRQIDAGLIYIENRYGSPVRRLGALAGQQLVLSSAHV